MAEPKRLRVLRFYATDDEFDTVAALGDAMTAGEGLNIRGEAALGVFVLGAMLGEAANRGIVPHAKDETKAGEK